MYRGGAPGRAPRFASQPREENTSEPGPKDSPVLAVDSHDIVSPAVVAAESSQVPGQGIGDFGLCYLRAKEKREVDFLVTRDGHPFFMVEAKSSETDPSPNLSYFQNILDIPAIQVVNRPGIARVHRSGSHRTLVVTAARWLAGLG